MFWLFSALIPVCFLLRCLFGFPRQDLSFGFLPSSLPFCFFHNALSRNFACGSFIQIFQRFKFQFKIWQTSVFCKFVHFQGDIFRSMSCIFFFTIATIFARDPRHQYSFMHECNSTLNALSSIPNQNASSRLAI